MKRLLPALLGLSVLLTACPGNSTPPPILSVSQDGRVLQGRWTGELLERLTVYPGGVVAGGGRVYLLDSSVGQQTRLLALDAETGTPLAALERPGARAVAWRDGAVLLLGGGRLTVHDPLTLELREALAVAGDFLSADGQVAAEAFQTPRLRVATLTGQPLPTADLGGAFPSDRASDDAWWLVGGRAVRARDGLSLAGASAHGNPCRLTPAPTPLSVESAPGGGVLLGYSDGVVEERGPGGELVRAVPVSDDCQPVVDLLKAGEGVAWLTGRLNGGYGAGRLGLADGRVTARQTRSGNVQPFLTAAGVLVRTPGTADRYDFQPWGSESRALAQKGFGLTLDLQTVRRDEHTADVTGTATLDGRPLRVEGRLLSGGAVLAQWSPVPPPTLRAELTLWEGTRPVGTLTGHVMVSGSTGEAIPTPAVPLYRVSLTLADQERPYDGDLRRP